MTAPASLLARLCAAVRALAGDRRGSAAMEYAVVGPIFLVASVGIAEVGNAFWQWNAAIEAVSVGLRRAAISDPVSSDITTMTGLGGTLIPGDPMPYFQRICSGATASCSDGGVYDRAAMNALVYGPGRTSCETGTVLSMCDVLPAIRPENVVVEYVQTGLGFAGRPGGPVPTITIRLEDLPIRWVLIGAIFGLDDVALPPISTSTTGEDLNSAS